MELLASKGCVEQESDKIWGFCSLPKIEEGSCCRGKTEEEETEDVGVVVEVVEQPLTTAWRSQSSSIGKGTKSGTMSEVVVSLLEKDKRRRWLLIR